LAREEVSAGGSNARFEASLASFDEAASQLGAARERQLEIAELPVTIHLAGPALERLLLGSLEHLAAAVPSQRRPAATPHLVVRAWDHASTGIPLPPVPRISGSQRAIAYLESGGLRAAFNPNSGVHSLLAPPGRAIWATASAAELPVQERAAPLRTIFQWWMADQRRLLVHAAAVGRHGRGVLIAGGEGAGKSTTAWACLRRGMECAGDDYVIVAAEPPDRAFALYSSIKLDPASLQAAPDRECLAAAVSAPRAGIKAVLDMGMSRAGTVAKSLSIDALLVARVGRGRKTVVRDATAAEAFKALAPTTLYLQAGAREHAACVLSSLVRRVPCRTLELGGDLDGVYEAIAGVIERVAP
jgi:hypothetical protein